MTNSGKGPDGGLRAIARKHLSKRGFVLWSVETGTTVCGMSDTFWTHAGERACGWIEYKSTEGATVGLSSFQVGFLRSVHRAGGRGHVMVMSSGRATSGVAPLSLWLAPGAAAAGLEEKGLLRCSAAVRLGTGTPLAWDWDAVAKALLVTPDLPALEDPIPVPRQSYEQPDVDIPHTKPRGRGRARVLRPPF